MRLFTFALQGWFTMAAGEVRTRRQSATELENFIGSLKKQSDIELPTLRAALRHSSSVPTGFKIYRGNGAQEELSVKDIVQELIPYIVGLWGKANIGFQHRYHHRKAKEEDPHQHIKDGLRYT